MARLQFGKALKTASELIKSREYLETGIPELDRLLSGGFVRGEISEVVGAVSGGRTSLALAALANATATGEVVAYIDTYGGADPHSTKQAGVDLARFLWIRCDGSAEKALAAADMLIRGGGFGIIVLDLTGPDQSQAAGKSHSHTWFRLKQSLEGTRIVFLVLNSSPVSGSLASLVLGLKRREAVWTVSKGERMEDRETGRQGDKEMGRQGERADSGRTLSLARKLPVPRRARAALFKGMFCEAQVFRGKSHGSATFYCDFCG